MFSPDSKHDVKSPFIKEYVSKYIQVSKIPCERKMNTFLRQEQQYLPRSLSDKGDKVCESRMLLLSIKIIEFLDKRVLKNEK